MRKSARPHLSRVVAGIYRGALYLLQRLAWLAPAPIPTTLLDVPIPGEEADLRDALVELEALSLARFSDNGGSFTVHRLVQAVTQQDQATDPDHARLAEALQWVNDAFAGDAQDVRDWPALEPLAAHAARVAGHGADRHLTAPCARLLNQVGVLLNSKAQYAEAEPLMRRALDIVEATSGSKHHVVAISLNNLATLLCSTNRAVEAEPLMRRACAIDEFNFGPEHPSVALHLHNLAALLKATNRLRDAEPLMRRALKILETHFGSDHEHIAPCLNNLAQLLQETNRLAEAEPLMLRTLAIDVASFGRDHPSVARDLNNLARLLHATDRPTEAEPLLHRALIICLKSLGPIHPNSQLVTCNYISLLQALGHTEAEITESLRTLLDCPTPSHACNITRPGFPA
ncbi:tetratricopeptide repeat protein [uncultured Zoogloea sp.]|uniref:tetratricopeptide repeat protein n=1 Tax=uncultured Zoogloea sp. TaxID=160237 RepID=UPI00263445F9|nr:tetratricopeptide repeat protein [uncultured Zoogloea sp.]